MKHIYILISALFLISSNLSATVPSWKNYPYYPAGSKIVFPDDEGKHKVFPGLEWWYVVMHVRGEKTGHDYSILVTHFNNWVRFFTITDVTAKTHKSGSAFGKLDSNYGYLDLTQTTKHGVDFLKTKRNPNNELIPFEYQMETNYENMNLSAELKVLKKPLMVAKTGYVQIGSSGYSWYYSFTKMEAAGTLEYNGIVENFKGIGWFDHQWGPFLVSPVEVGGIFESYEWFCLQLDNGMELMLSNIYDRDYNLPKEDAYGGAGLLDNNENAFGTLEKRFTRTAYWQDPTTGNYMSMGWRLEIPEWNLDLIMTPKFKDQMVAFPLNGSFWEGSIGIKGTVNGKPVTGNAYGELIHRFELPKLYASPIKRYISIKDPIKLTFDVKNPDAGNPLQYEISLLDEANREFSIIKNLTVKTFTFFLKDYISLLSNKTSFRIKIRAYSIDEVIQKSIASDFIYIVKDKENGSQEDIIFLDY